MADSSIPHRPRLGWMAILVGVALMAIGGVIVLTAGQDTGCGVMALAVGLLLGGGLLALRGKRLRQPSAEELLARDPRPPVLYLRSFADEGRDHGFVGFWRSQLSGREMLWSSSQWFPRVLEELGKTVRRQGPFIALARPGERLPELGAAWLEVPDAQWRQRVTELLHRAGFVIYRAGATEGLRWELEHMVTTFDPRRILVLLPAARADYESFRDWSSQVLPHPLPPKPPKVRYVTFRRDWTPIPLWSPEELRQLVRGEFDPATPRTL